MSQGKLFDKHEQGRIEFNALMERLYILKAAMALPKLKNGIYHQGGKAKTSDWIVATPDVASIFEAGSVGFAPEPVELKSFKQWNKEQMEKKCQIV